jgi:lipopolysaccharide export LptBFGC system permease protein LptF
VKVISKYLVSNTLRISLVALLVFNAIFFVGSSVTAARMGLDLAQFIQVSPFLWLYVLRYTLPMSLLVGVAFVLGKMQSEREILALRASGVHFATIAFPLLVLGLLFSAGLYGFNGWLLPYCDYSRRDVIRSFALELLTLQKGCNKSIKLPGYIVFCREYDGHELRGLIIFRDEPELPFEIVAREGHVWLSRDKLHIVIALKGVQITFYGSKEKAAYGELVSDNYSIFVPIPQIKKDRPSFFTMTELAEQSRLLREQIDSSTASCKAAGNDGESSENLAKLIFLKRQIELEYHHRSADAITPFIFLLVAIPIPLLLKSRNILIPVFVSLMLVGATQYVVRIGLVSFARMGTLDTWFAMWIGDLLTVSIGVFLFWKLSER